MLKDSDISVGPNKIYSRGVTIGKTHICKDVLITDKHIETKIRFIICGLNQNPAIFIKKNYRWPNQIQLI